MPRKKPLTKSDLEGISHICQTAADYLQHPDVAEVAKHFALPGSNVVRALRAVVDVLKTV